MKQTRRDFVKAAGLGLAAASLARTSSEAAAVTRPPNILVILVDDLGYGDLACYGAPDLDTPHIDALMKRGMRFDHFYANCPVCSPTRAALLTGRYPDLVGVPGVIRTRPADNFGYLHPDAALIPERLKPAGYHSALIGKWHLGLESPNTPNGRGFDYFHGFLGDMMDDYYTHRRHGINYMRENETEIDPSGHATDLFTQWAVEYIHRRAKKDDPFFLYLAYNAPHTPIQPPDEWVARVTSRERGINPKRAKLAALIEHLDAGIGRVLDTLEEEGLDDDTLIIFTSDNGGQSSVGARNGALRGGKQNMYEGGIRVPMCAVWPGVITPGARSDAVALTMDILPTLCEAAGVSVSHAVDGQSMMPALRGRPVPDANRTLVWMRREGNQYGGRAYYAIRQGDWKLLQNTPFERMRLYNLADDPREAHPVKGKRAIYARLFNALREHVQESGRVPWQR